MSFIEISESADYIGSGIAHLYQELDVMAQMGVGIRHMTGRDLTEVWRETVAMDGLLYVPADLYLIPGYGNYLASHWGHWFLVTDHGDHGDFVIIIEAGDGELHNAVKREISIGLLSEAHQSWVENSKDTVPNSPEDWKDELSAIFGASAKKDISSADALETYMILAKRCQSQLEAALDQLNSSTHRCYRAMQKADYDWALLAHRLKGIVRTRRTEAYKLRAATTATRGRHDAPR